jgi:hypothetical protein
MSDVCAARFYGQAAHEPELLDLGRRYADVIDADRAIEEWRRGSMG